MAVPTYWTHPSQQIIFNVIFSSLPIKLQNLMLKWRKQCSNDSVTVFIKKTGHEFRNKHCKQSKCSAASTSSLTHLFSGYTRTAYSLYVCQNEMGLTPVLWQFVAQKKKAWKGVGSKKIHLPTYNSINNTICICKL